jgi:hypothetical protein
VFRTLSLAAAILAFSLAAADPAEARKRGGDISGGVGKDRSAAHGESKDSKTIGDYSSPGRSVKDHGGISEDESPVTDADLATSVEPTTETTQGGVTYDLDVDDATVGSEATTPTADYDLEVAPGPDWDYWAREAGVIQ